MDQQLFATLLARQGIYNKNGSVYAYELLYRDPLVNVNKTFTNEEETSSVITQLFANLDIDTIIGNKRAFISFSYKHLVQKIPNLLPKDRIVIEVLETVDVDKPLINSLLSLREQGYKIALHDFIVNEKNSLLIELVDIIKLNVLYQNKQQIAQQLKPLKQFNGHLLAKKIENNSQFNDCIDLGFTYFQGSFLNKPDLLKGQKLTENKSNLIHLLAELNDQNITMERVEELILQIPKLSYRVLRLANSVSLYRGKQIDSVMDSLKMLGLNQIHNWLCLFLLSNQDDLITDLLERTLIRAKMCEYLAQVSGYFDPHQAYTVGILSTLDRFLNEPMESLLSKIQLNKALNEALLHQKGELGDFLQVAIDYEFANFKKLERTSYDKQDLTRSYVAGIEYARSVMDLINQ